MAPLVLSMAQQDAEAATEGTTRTTDDEEDRVSVVHSTGGWRLAVRENGAVEAESEPYDGTKRWTTKEYDSSVPPRSEYRYGKSIEKIIARYAHETRFERDPEEHGGALRRGIIEALCTLAPTTFPDSDNQPVGVVYINAPTGPSTHIVSEDYTDTATYATFHPFETESESAEADQ